jgi:uncharacterized membrane protein
MELESKEPVENRSTGSPSSVIRDNWLIIALVLLAFMIRVIAIGDHSFWFDEGLEIGRAFSKWPDLLILNEGPDPPVFRLLLAPLVRLSDCELFLRLPSALFGTLSVFLIYRWITVLGTRSLGLIAAGLLTIAPIAVYYSQEVSQYSLVVSLALLLLIAFEKVIQVGTRRDWIALALVGLLGMSTYYGLLLLIPVLDARVIWKIWKERGRKTISGFLAVHIIWLLGLLFLYVFFIREQYTNVKEVTRVALFFNIPWGDIPSIFFDDFFHLILRYQTTIFSESAPIYLPGILLIGIVGGMLLLVRLKPQVRHLIPTFIVLILVQFIASGLNLYRFGGRYSLIILPYIILFLASLIWGIYHYSRPAGTIVGGLVVILFLWFSPNLHILPNPWMELPVEEIRPALSYMHENKSDDEFVYVYYGAKPAFQVYEREANYPYYLGSWFRDWPIEDKISEIQAAAQGFEGFWLIMSHVGQEEIADLKAALISEPYDYRLMREYSGENAYAWLFDRRG